MFGVYQGHSNIQSQTTTITNTFTANMFSMTVIEVANTALSVGENDLIEVAIYPNPVKDILTISTQENINTVQIFDLTGKQVLQVKNPIITIDVSQLKSSIYILKIMTDDEVSTKKLIKK